MSNTPCACAELFQLGDDYRLEHHPDCHFKATVLQHGDIYPCVSTPSTAPVSDRQMGKYITQPFEVTTYPAPIDCSAVRHTLNYADSEASTTLCAGCVCPNCRAEYEASVTIPFFQQWAELSCPHCKQRIMWFADEQAVEHYRRLLTNDPPASPCALK